MSLLRLSLLTTCAAALVAAVGWVAFGSDWLLFRQLRVVGNERASEAQIRHLADLEPGQPLLALDLDHAVGNVSRHPWVARVEARRVFPDTIVLEVRERQVRALLLLDELYLVDTEGTPFRKADTSDLDHPVLTGIPLVIADTDAPMARRLVQEGLAVLEAATGHGNLRESDISEVRFDAEAGYTLALRNGGEVLLGFQRDTALARLDALSRRGLDLSHPLHVDLGSPSQAVVSPL